MKSLFAIAALASTIFNSNAATLTAKEQANWLADIQFYENEVKTKHINPFHTVSEIQFDQRVSALKNDLATLSEAEVEARIMEITGAIGDGHSNYFMMSGPHKHFPLRFKYFGDVLHVVDTSEANRSLLGAELKAVNGYNVTELFNKISPLLPGVDNKFSARARFEYYLTLHKLLLGLNITAAGKPTHFEFTLSGKNISKEITPVSMGEFGQLNTAYKQTLPKLQHLNITMPGIKLSFLNNKKVAYFPFKSYPKFEQLVEGCEALKTQLQNAKSRYLIVDFRGNGGGSFYTGLAFSSCLLSLDQFDWQQGTFVLTDNDTFSAAMSNSVQFKQILNAQIVGTPTGGDPNHYGESYRFTLPNSKRRLSLSKRYYAFEKQAVDAVYPDIHIETTWQDYKQGKDTVLLEVLKLIDEKIAR